MTSLLRRPALVRQSLSQNHCSSSTQARRHVQWNWQPNVSHEASFYGKFWFLTCVWQLGPAHFTTSPGLNESSQSELPQPPLSSEAWSAILRVVIRRLGRVLTRLHVFILFLAAAMGPTLEDGNEVTCTQFLMAGDWWMRGVGPGKSSILL